jgi:3-dehydroquinate synthase
MKVVSVRAEREYDVRIDVDYREELLSLAGTRDKVAVIFSESMKEQVNGIALGDAEVFYFPVSDSEAAKSTQTLLQIWDWLGAAGFTRSDLIVGIGGGAITDLAGFAAATWLRGIDWIAVPTTVAGMVDAAVGGKTGINSEYGKNLIGAFNSPQSVLIDTSWLPTLSDRDFAAGLAEVVKCGFIKDVEILNLLKGKELSEIRKDLPLTTELIERSVKVKGAVVSVDFKESFDREILNYGHTFGHAVELDAKYSLRHGECVSIGMVFVAELSLALGLLSEEILASHKDILRNLGLPTTYKGTSWESLLAHMRLDKKSRGSTLRFVVLDGLGKTQRVEGPEEGALLTAYEKVCS